MFRQFRALGLRHLLVVNDEGEVVGMVSRKDLARHKVVHHGGSMERATIHVTEQVEWKHTYLQNTPNCFDLLPLQYQ